MRRRYQLNLYTESDIESDLADYIEQVSQGSKRSEEIRRFCLIGYQVLMKGKRDDEAILQSYDPGLKQAVANYAKSEREKSHKDSELSELISLLKNNEKSKEELLLESLVSNDNSELVSLLLEKINKKNSDSLSNSSIANELKSSPVSIPSHVGNEEQNEEQMEQDNEVANKVDIAPPHKNMDLSSRYTPNLERQATQSDFTDTQQSIMPINHKELSFLSEAEDLDIDEDEILEAAVSDEEEIKDPLSVLGF